MGNLKEVLNLLAFGLLAETGSLPLVLLVHFLWKKRRLEMAFTLTATAAICVSSAPFAIAWRAYDEHISPVINRK